MPESNDFKDKVQRLVQQWSDSEEEPPFSCHELIAMALVLHNGPMDREDITKWIFSAFGYYRSLALEILWDHVTDSYACDKSDDAVGFYQDFELVFLEFELPVTQTDSDDIDVYMKWHDGIAYEMTTAATQIVLRDVIPESRQGTFPFFDLPPELRNDIYGMVLRYPLSGLLLNGTCDREFNCATRDYSRSYSYELWDEKQSHGDELQRIFHREILNLLLVNKQMREEAMPIFYDLNTFILWGVKQVLHLQSLAPARQGHLRHIVLWYHYMAGEGLGLKFGPQAFEILQSLPNLRKLEIHMDEEQFFNHRKSKYGVFHTAQTIPGLSLLPKLSEKAEITFDGDCPTVATHWKSEIEKHTKAPEPKQKKRKLVGSGRKQPARTAKALKAGQYSDDVSSETAP